MTSIGTVIDGKYEILKEIGRGGMSVVYLAMDKRLNKQWAVKEIIKKGSGKNNEIIVNSLLAEANLMKRLDHPALPRIVDIIDNGITIYIVMDYVEGESLDKVLKAEGRQPEKKVIGWAKQICDALSYLHSQKPPIIYRDMKPANVMKKPEGNIKIIDFGIAREYKEQKLADTTVLGTKGYAPPEQYSGQTDPRSDIFALGMTMHHLLTGADPRTTAYVPVRQYDPELSEGIEIIIGKCVEPAAENRYQTCADLLYDLEHPELITKGFKKKQKRRLASVIATGTLAVIMAVAGTGFKMKAAHINNSDYEFNLNSNEPEKLFSAVEIYPNRVDAYNKLIEYCINNEHSMASNEKNDCIKKIGNTIDSHADALDCTKHDAARLYYSMGKLYFSYYEGDFKTRAISAQNYFKVAADDSTADFDKKPVAKCYYMICRFMNEQNRTSEHTLNDYEAIFEKINEGMRIVEEAKDSEAQYDKISFYYVAMLLINDQAEYMAGVNFNKTAVIEKMEEIRMKVENITSSLSYVKTIQDEIDAYYELFMQNINAKYNEMEKRQAGGN